MDFLSDSFADGRRFRVLNVINTFSRECLAIEVGTSLPSIVVTRVPGRVAAVRGYPAVIVMDNGPEFCGREINAWAFRQKVRLHFVDPGKPMQNGFVESFNDRFRYNSSIGRVPPAVFAHRAAALQAPPAPSGPRATVPLRWRKQ